MPSILLGVFLIQLVIHLIEIVAVSTVNNQLWKIWNSIFSSSSKDSAEYQELKTQALKLRKELNATSSQDEFAKWAKLRRQYDKVAEKLEKTKSSLDGTRSKFDSKIMMARWLCINGARIILQFSYQKQPMFYIPKYLVPYYAEWVLSFPRAPLGSISLQIWSLSCKAFISLVLETGLHLISFFHCTKLEKQKQQPEKMNMPVNTVVTVENT